MVNELVVEPPVRRFCFFMILYTDDAECASIFGLRPRTKIQYELIITDFKRTVLRSSYCNNNFKIGSKIANLKSQSFLLGFFVVALAVVVALSVILLLSVVLRFRFTLLASSNRSRNSVAVGLLISYL